MTLPLINQILVTSLVPTSIEGLGTLIVGLVGGSSLVVTVLLLTAKGYWDKHVVPLITGETSKWYQDPAQKLARETERDTWVKNWYDLPVQRNAREVEREAWLKQWLDSPVQRNAREIELKNVLNTPSVVDQHEREIKKIIDNEIKRTDGLISKEIQTQVSDMESRLMTKLEEVAQFLKDDTAFKQQMIQRMAKLEGAIHALIPYKPGADSQTAMPQVHPTKPR